MALILENKDNMKRYDVILMNPPYSKTLHLDFIKRILKISNKVINISPCGWLCDIPAVIGWKKTTYQRYEESVGKHIKSLDILGKNANDANKHFKIGSFENLGIYELDNEKHDIYSKIYLEDKRKNMSIFDKVIKPVYNGQIKCIAKNIKISGIHGHPGQRDEFDVVTPKYKLVEKLKPQNMSKNSFKNWHNSCNTKFMKYCNLLTRQGQHLHLELLPFMNDYNEPWDDKRFYKYFNLSNEEQELIENVMEKYMY